MGISNKPSFSPRQNFKVTHLTNNSSLPLFLSLILLLFSVNTHSLTASNFVACADNVLFCEIKQLPLLDTLPETSTIPSVFRSATTPHSNTCSEQQLYQSENVIKAVKGLTLNFKPNTPVQYNAFCDRTYTQTSGAIYTSNPITKNTNNTLILHGAVRVKAILPQIIPGIWPAIWMLPQDTAFTFRDGGSNAVWPTSGEIDTIEMAGYSQFYNPASTYLTTLHFGSAPNDDIPRGYFTVHQQQGNPAPLSTAEHEYTLEWNITLKNSEDIAITRLDINQISSIQFLMYLDGQLFQSDQRNWNTYFPSACNNGLVETGISNGQTCGFPLFTIPSADDPLPENDQTPLQTFTNGFNSGFRLIMNLASGGPIFFADPVGQAGAQSSVNMFISKAEVITIHDMIFDPNIFNGATIAWHTPSGPGITIDHYHVSVSGPQNFRIEHDEPFGKNEFIIPAHTFYGNRSYTVKVNAITTAGESLLLGKTTTTIRP